MGWALLGLLGLGSVVAIASDVAGDSGATTTTVGSLDPSTEAGGTGDDDGDDATGDTNPGDTESDGSGTRSFTIAATGELLIHEAVADAAATPDGWDFSPMLALVEPTISAADLAICHVETPMSPDNSSLSYYPAFSVPNQLATAIAATGFDTCSLASNHALDTGRNGVEGTLDALDAVDVRHAGMARSEREAESTTLIDVNGVVVAHLSYTYAFNGGEPPAGEEYLAALIDEGDILGDAALARDAGAEFVVVSLHWGTEYAADPDGVQLDLGPRLLGSAAIDLIIGHGAHVIQPVAEVGDEVLAYGLGNLLSNQSPESCTGCPDGTQDGVILELTVTEGPAGAFTVTDLTHTPTWVDRTTYEVVPVRQAAGTRDPTVLGASADRTSAALSALGLTVAS